MNDLPAQAAPACTGESSRFFAGFERLTANYIYCPNQFFDVCLPNSSRGVVRLVAYLLRRTLGWLDDAGQPIEQNIAVTYHDFITKAGISRGMIRQTIDEATAARFISCTHPGRANSSGTAGQTASYILRWDHAATNYVADPHDFDGFYANEGNRTPIPNAFFDRIIPSEPLAVSKVVGIVLRHTVGYQNQFGGRRSDAPLSYSFMHANAKIRGTRSLAQAIHRAIDAGYIRRVQEGSFNPNSNLRRPASYAVQWLEEVVSHRSGSKWKAAERFEKGSREPVQKGKQQEFENESRNGSKMKVVERFEKVRDRKTQMKNTSKQQPHAAVAVENLKAYEMLKEEGFDDATARRLASSTSLEQIAEQIAWLPKRNPSKNPLGLLLRAIEGNWQEPVTPNQEQQRRSRERNRDEDAERQTEAEALVRERQHHQKLHTHWLELSPQKQSSYFDTAITNERSPSIRSLLNRRRRDPQNPPPHVLTLLAADLR